MNYSLFKSIVKSRKTPIPLDNPTASFFMAEGHPESYVEPDFTKLEFSTEKPPLILVSAVGASGKTTTAHALSSDVHLPILDLAKHKPVADHTLTGILTSVYSIAELSGVFRGLNNGSHGVIIDGMDEGRSKTTEKAFQAFLDDLVKLSKTASSTSLILFGRSQVLFDAWAYLDDQEIDVGLIQLDPFNLIQARTYIANKVPNVNRRQSANFEQVRDDILEKLGAVFKMRRSGGTDKKFLEFIGYPPVLDAISTLLREQKNYHNISTQLLQRHTTETQLVIRICDYLANREHEEKTKPAFIDNVLKRDLLPHIRDAVVHLYGPDEQCARVLAQALNTDLKADLIPDSNLLKEYEDYLSSWVEDHPFLNEGQLRNAVFQAYCVGTMCTQRQDRIS